MINAFIAGKSDASASEMSHTSKQSLLENSDCAERNEDSSKGSKSDGSGRLDPFFQHHMEQIRKKDQSSSCSVNLAPSGCRVKARKKKDKKKRRSKRLKRDA